MPELDVDMTIQKAFAAGPAKRDRSTMTMRKFFYLLAMFTLIAASFQHLVMRLIWTGFAIAFLVAADRCKDIERAKWKERMDTELRMKRAELEGWEKSLDGRFTFIVEQVGKAFENALSGMSTYVKDASPSRVAYRKLPDEGIVPTIQTTKDNE